MKFINSTLLLLTAVLLSACSSNDKVTIDTEYSQATNFSNFKYYRWHQGTNDKTGNTEKEESKEGKTVKVNELLDSNIRYAIDKSLSEKGLSTNANGTVDFLVHYRIASKHKADVESQKVYEGYSQSFQFYNGYGYAGRYGTGVAMTMDATPVEELSVERYREGSLILDFINPTTNKLIWQSIAQKRLSEDKLSSEEQQKVISNIVNDMLANFPPK